MGIKAVVLMLVMLATLAACGDGEPTPTPQVGGTLGGTLGFDPTPTPGGTFATPSRMDLAEAYDHGYQDGRDAGCLLVKAGDSQVERIKAEDKIWELVNRGSDQYSSDAEQTEYHEGFSDGQYMVVVEEAGGANTCRRWGWFPW